MAKKSAAVEPPEVDYNDIHTTPIEDILSAPSAEEEPVKDEKVEEPVKETPKEEVTYEEVPFDPETYKKQLRDEILGEASKLVEKTVPAPKADQPDDELVSPWDKEKRTPKDYNEITDWAIQKQQILNKRAEAEHQKEVENQKKVAEDQNKQQIESFNKYTDELLNDLRNSGKLAKVVNPNDPNDPGVIAQKALFQKMLDVNIERQKQNKQPVYSVKEIYYDHFQNVKPEPEEVPGADAPVSPSKASPSTETKELDYVKDIQPGRNFASWLTDALRGNKS